MIIDRMDRADRYVPLHRHFARAFSSLRKAEIVSAVPGRYDLAGDDIFALVQTLDLKPPSQGRWEAHQQYIDVQYVHRGSECFGWADVTTLAIDEPYDASRDVAFYSGSGSFLTVPSGYFIIFFPEDAHMPGLLANDGSTVSKTVIKVRV